MPRTSPRANPRRLALLLCLLLLPFAASPQEGPPPHPAPTQAPALGDRLDLAGVWLIHAGDDPAFSSPTLNDSAWDAVNTREQFNFFGQGNVNHLWYRLHVKLVPGSHALALTLSNIGGSYRVFSNGRELGGHGSMAGRGEYLVSLASTFSIPDDLLASGDLVIAIHAVVGTVDRVSFTLRDGISPDSSIFLGPASLLARDQVHALENSAGESDGILTLWAVLFLLALALSFLVQKVPAYPVLAVLAGAHLFSQLLLRYSATHYLSQTHWITWPINLLQATLGIATIEFLRIVAGSRRSRWLTVVEAAFLFSVLAVYPASLSWMSFRFYSILHKLIKIVIAPFILFFLFKGMRRKQQDARILVGTACFYLLYLAWWGILHVLHPANDALDRLATWFINAFPPAAAANLALVLGFFILLIVRTLRIVRERASIATEIQAARTMQQLLLGRAPQATPGFAVETVYHPAGEVGGDFFLISPTPDGALTAIVGDVSGKGLLAAMRVSMILGVLRREPSREPAAMLEGLNQALTSQAGDGSSSGFTTACAVRVEPSGRYTVANAGHISPYLLGAETSTPPALPLGLAPDQTYETASGTLRPGERLVLLSDGIPEARSPKGELLGFDRLPALTLQPASYIAAAAQSFGQDDDITVVTIACTPTSAVLGQAQTPPPPPSALRPTPPPPPPPRAAPPPPPMPNV